MATPFAYQRAWVHSSRKIATHDNEPKRNRTQEVAGSSPASSIKDLQIAGRLFSKLDTESSWMLSEAVGLVSDRVPLGSPRLSRVRPFSRSEWLGAHALI